ncbi:MAG: RNA pseudouridine synthase [Chitinophagaceae bacterium]|nr:RNA pseudouridine synthase [Chitinophagaceae bacterium]
MIFENNILFEDNHLLIVNKPSGILSQGDSTQDSSLIDFAKEYIKKKYAKKGNVFVGLVHRIDRPASGIVMLTKTSKALERMTQAWRERVVEKKYIAMVDRVPQKNEGIVRSWLEKDVSKNKVTSYNYEKKGTVFAELSYKVYSRMKNRAAIEIQLTTGRPHQIRVQMREIGCCIIGDVKYGYTKKNNDGSILLHAYELSFTHPVNGNYINIKSTPVWLPEYDGS